MGAIAKRLGNRDIRVLFRKNGADLGQAKALVEEICTGIGHCHEFYEKLKKLGVPKSTRRWLMSLSARDRARVVIVENSIADQVYAQTNMWKNFESAGYVLTRTILAYPPMLATMPGLLEYREPMSVMEKTIHIVETKDFAGEKRIAIAFDEYEIEESNTRLGKVLHYMPKGKVHVIEDFPQRVDSIELDERSRVLGEPGEERFIHRIDGLWIGPIVRTYLGGYSLPPRESIFVRFQSKDKFGVLITIAQKEEKQEPFLQPAKEIKLLPEKAEAAEIPKLKELDPEARARLRGRIVERVRHYSGNLDDLNVSTPALIEVGAEYAFIAADNRAMQESLREFVRATVSREFNDQIFRLEHSKEHALFQSAGFRMRKPSFFEINKTADKICNALGIPHSNEK